ncbi:MAG: lipopolysaccharide assembly protein LapA domain-containing protein [Elainella sp.]
MTRFLTSCILALWVSGIAIIAIQNATPVALRLLNAESVAIPLGLVIAFSAALGMVGTSLALGLWQSLRS